jgi:hypothetical protein
VRSACQALRQNEVLLGGLSARQRSGLRRAPAQSPLTSAPALSESFESETQKNPAGGPADQGPPPAGETETEGEPAEAEGLTPRQVWEAWRARDATRAGPPAARPDTTPAPEAPARPQSRKYTQAEALAMLRARNAPAPSQGPSRGSGGPRPAFELSRGFLSRLFGGKQRE